MDTHGTTMEELRTMEDKTKELSLEQKESRVRINLKQGAKGNVQWDITCEFPTLEETKENLMCAIDAAREVMKCKCLEEAGLK